MKLRKLMAVLLAVSSLSMSAVGLTGSKVQAASSINAEAEKYSYSGTTYLYKMLKAEGIKYHKFPGVKYRTGKPEGVVVHETADAGATAYDEAVYFNRAWDQMYAYVHAFVDNKQLIQMRSPDMGVWGAGPNANNRFIQIELCEVTTRAEFAKSVNNDAIWIAHMLHRYNLKPDLAVHDGKGTVWSHLAVSTFLGGTDHGDPDGYFAKWGYSMDQFYDLILHYYDLQAKKPTVKNSEKVNSEAAAEYASSVVGAVTTGHEAYIYDADGKRTKQKKSAGSAVNVLGYKLINKRKFYQIGSNRFVVASNIDGTMRSVKKNTVTYDSDGGAENSYLTAGTKVKTYGSHLRINGKNYYALNASQYVLTSDVD